MESTIPDLAESFPNGYPTGGEHHRPTMSHDALVQKYGRTLVRASREHRDYWVKLTDGALVAFCEAALDGDWVHLYQDDDEPGGVLGSLQKTELLRIPWQDRGVSVPLSQIVWVVEASTQSASSGVSTTNPFQR